MLMQLPMQCRKLKRGPRLTENGLSCTALLNAARDRATTIKQTQSRASGSMLDRQLLLSIGGQLNAALNAVLRFVNAAANAALLL